MQRIRRLSERLLQRIERARIHSRIGMKEPDELSLRRPGARIHLPSSSRFGSDPATLPSHGEASQALGRVGRELRADEKNLSLRRKVLEIRDELRPGPLPGSQRNDDREIL